MNTRPKQLPVVRCLRCSYQEDEAIREAATRAGLTISDYLRGIVLALPPHAEAGRSGAEE